MKLMTNSKLRWMFMVVFSLVGLSVNAQGIESSENNTQQEQSEIVRNVESHEKPFMKLANFQPTSPDRRMNEYRYNLLLLQYKLDYCLSLPVISEKEIAELRDKIKAVEMRIERQKPEEDELISLNIANENKMKGIEVSENTVSKKKSPNNSQSRIALLESDLIEATTLEEKAAIQKQIDSLKQNMDLKSGKSESTK